MQEEDTLFKHHEAIFHDYGLPGSVGCWCQTVKRFFERFFLSFFSREWGDGEKTKEVVDESVNTADLLADDGENSKTFHGPGGATPGRMVLPKQLASYYSCSR